jgi:hypothetical protein
MIERTIPEMASADFTHACLAFLASKLVKGEPITLQSVQETLEKIRDDLRDETSELRAVLGHVPEGTQTLYWSEVGSVHDRTVALFQIAMVP